MSDLKPLLERANRAVADLPLPSGGFEGIERRRARKQRNRRIRACAVAIIVALATAAALARSFESARVPADQPPLGAGDVLMGSSALVARDPETAETRTIVHAGSLPHRAESITGAAWSHDRKWVAFRAGGLWVADAESGVSRQLTGDQGWNPWAWSPVEDRLAVVQGQHVTLVDAATGREADLGTAVGAEDTDGYAVHALGWSEDGTRIAYDGGRGWGSVYSIDVKSGEHTLLVRPPAGTGPVTDIDWSPDGAFLAIRYADASQHGPEALYVANADGSHIRLADQIAASGHNASRWSVWQPGQNVGTAWSPDGTRFAYTSRSGPEGDQELEVRTFSVDGSAPSLVTSQCCEVEWASPVWSPDGSQLAFGTRDSSATGINPHYLVVNADGTGDAREINPLIYQSWAGGWLFCFCYG
jgi:Tol biopolymer transport system component